jgi:hypothetical protein
VTLVVPAEQAGLQERLAETRARIDDAARRAGRDGAEVRLILATKTQTAERVRTALKAAADLGLEPPRLGENRAREGRDKAAVLGATTAAWSMIGHVQSNKVDDVLAFASEVQSLDRLSLAMVLEKRLQRDNRAIDVLVQVNTSGEASKFGLPPPDLLPFLRALTPFCSLRVRGLMTLATQSEDEEAVRRCFRSLRELRDRARQDVPGCDSLCELSMGMSGDFEVAVEEGATQVRVGEAVFGARHFRPEGGWWPERVEPTFAPAGAPGVL